jgi:glutamyl-Q tRNA(Asp) synthetase
MPVETTPDTPPYRGRFAPSPTGPLHFGSLVCAVGSYLQARHCQGQWLLRIEDLDQSREQAGAADNILRTLEVFGFEWDETVSYQSQRLSLYEQALAQLHTLQAIYPCGCSRKDIQALTDQDPHTRYPGTCREGLKPGKQARAIRVKTEPGEIRFTDTLQGDFVQDLAREVGDFVLKRADGFYAYQLAVVVDDAAQGISDVVRGADLLDNTPRQILLQQLLGLPTPTYLHLPIATDNHGAKLSKQTRAAPVEARRPVQALTQALRFLGHAPPMDIGYTDLDTLWQWAIANWRVESVPDRRQIPLSSVAESSMIE